MASISSASPLPGPSLPHLAARLTLVEHSSFGSSHWRLDGNPLNGFRWPGSHCSCMEPSCSTTLYAHHSRHAFPVKRGRENCCCQRSRSSISKFRERDMLLAFSTSPRASLGLTSSCLSYGYMVGINHWCRRLSSRPYSVWVLVFGNGLVLYR